jgi:hypothetical protein
MVSITQVYNSVKDIVNKEQKGFITPVAFNSLANIAQIKIFNELMDEFIEGRKLTRQNLDNVNTYSYVRRKQEDLSNFIQDINVTGTDGTYPKPSNMVKLISISNYTIDEEDVVDYDIEIVYNPELFSHIIKSNLSSPTENYKVAFIDSNSIKIRPVTDIQITIKYFMKPGSVLYDGTYSPLNPYYAVTTEGGIEFENSNATRNFMLPPHYAPELVAEICEMIGVRLRDRDVQSFGQQKSAEQ